MGLAQQGPHSVRFELAEASSRRAQLPQRLSLSWFGGPPVNSGERWRLAVQLQRPSGLLNPMGLTRKRPCWLGESVPPAA